MNAYVVSVKENYMSRCNDYYQNISDNSRSTQRLEEVEENAVDYDNDGKLPCEEREGLSQGIFALPKTMLHRDVHNITMKRGVFWYVIKI